MLVLRRRPHLLALPLELREQMYRDIFLGHQSNAQVLRTCRQIYVEALPYLYKRPLTFASQGDLYGWLRNVGSKNAHHVTTICLQLQDIDLSPLLNTLTHPSILPTSSWELYKKEVQDVSTALSLLPNIRDVTVYDLKPHQSFLYRELYKNVVDLLGFHCIKLRRLTLHSKFQHLDFLKSFPHLETLRLTGFSFSSPSETLAIFSKMRYLKELEIFGQRTEFLTLEPVLDREPRPVQSLTPAVLQHMRPLSSLTIREGRNPQLGEQEALFFTPETFAALQLRHNNSLQTLRISLDFTPELESQEAFQAFLSGSRLQHLEFGWTDLEPEILWQLPSTIRTLQVSLGCSCCPKDILWGILRGVDDLPELHEVRLMADWDLMDLSFGDWRWTQMIDDDCIVASTDDGFQEALHFGTELESVIEALNSVGIRTITLYPIP